MSFDALERLRAAIARRPQELVEARQAGRKVLGYFCCYVPEEVIEALGLIPVRLGNGGDERLVDLGSRYASTKTCVFIREAVGQFAERTDPYVANSDIVAVAASCSQMYRLGELVKFHFGVPSVTLPVPMRFYEPEGVEYFRRALEDFVSQLEELSGQSLNADALREAVERHRQIRDNLAQIYRYQSIDDAPIAWTEVREVIVAGYRLDRSVYLELVAQLLSELRGRAATTQGRVEDDRPRILISGSNLAPGDVRTLEIVEKLGGRIVSDDLCTGLRSFSHIDVADATVAGVADAYLGRTPCASLPYPFAPEGDRRLGNLTEIAREFGVDGVIYQSLRFCDPYSFKAAETKEFLARRDTPFLEIYTEYAGSDVGAVETRIEAFFELLRLRRSERV